MFEFSGPSVVYLCMNKECAVYLFDGTETDVCPHCSLKPNGKVEDLQFYVRKVDIGLFENPEKYGWRL
jgi:hypothetical protein